MSMKKTDLAKNLALKISGQMKGAGTPGRFGQAASDVVDRKEQRRRDAAAGSCPSRASCLGTGEEDQRSRCVARRRRQRPLAELIGKGLG